MGQRGSRVTRGIVFAILGALCWGFSGTCASVLTTQYEIEVWWIVCMRLMTAGPFFLAVALVADRRRLFSLMRNPRAMCHMAIYAVVGVIFVQYAYTAAIKFTNTGTALLLQQLGLLIIMGYACLRARRLPLRREGLALFLALAGAVCIATQGAVTSLAISEVGLAWGVASAVALAGYNLIPIKLLDEYGSFITNGMSLTLGAVAVAPFVRPWEAPVQMPFEGWFALVGIIVFGTAMAYVLYLQGVKDAGPVKASLIAVLEPVSGMAFSAAWIGAPVTLWDALGCVLIGAMMILVSLLAKESGNSPEAIEGTEGSAAFANDEASEPRTDPA